MTENVDAAYLARRRYDTLAGDPAALAAMPWDRVETIPDRLGRPQRIGFDDRAGVSVLLGYDPPPGTSPAAPGVGQAQPTTSGPVGAGAASRPTQPDSAPPSEEPGLVTEIGRGVVHGANQVVEEFLKATRLDGVADWLDAQIGGPVTTEYRKPSTTSGEIAAGLAQGATALVPAARATKALGAVSQFARWAAAGGLVDGLAFSADEPGLADLAKELGHLDQPTLEAVRSTIADALGKNEDEGELAKRLKNVAGGALAGATIDGAVQLYRGARGLGGAAGQAFSNFSRMVDAADARLGAEEAAGAVRVHAGPGDTDRILAGMKPAVDALRKPKVAPAESRYVTVPEGEFVRLADGRLDFGQVREEVAATARTAGHDQAIAAPIRLEKGWDDPSQRANRNSTDGPIDDGLGEVHIEARHGDEIRAQGYEDAADLIADVATSYNRIAQGHSGRLILGKVNGREKIAVIELEPRGGYWTVVTAGIRNKGWMEKGSRALPWHRTEQSVATDVPLPSSPGDQGSDSRVPPLQEVDHPPAQGPGNPGAQDGTDTIPPSGSAGKMTAVMAAPAGVAAASGGSSPADPQQDATGEVQVADLSSTLLKAIARKAASGTPRAAGSETADAIAHGAHLPGQADVLANPWRAYKDGDPLAGTDFNFAHLDTTDAAKRQIEHVSAAYAGKIAATTGGTIPHEVTRQVADLLAVEPNAVAGILGGFEAGAVQDLHVKALVMRKALVESAERLDSLARTVASDPTAVTDADYLAFREHLARHAALQATMKGAQTEIARALSSFRIDAGASAAVRGQAAAELLNSLGGRVTAANIARRYLATPVEARGAFAAKSWYQTSKDVVFEVWINGLLSNPKTHLVNMASNTLFTLWQVPERAVAGAIGQARQALPGADPDRVMMLEAAAQLHGMVRGVNDGMRLAWEAFKTDTPSDLMVKVEAQQQRAISPEAFGMDPGSWGGRAVDYIGQGIRMPGRFLMASDEFFKAVGYRAELDAQAVRKAARAVEDGASKEDAAKIYADVLAGNDPATKAAAIDAAHVVTFTKELDDFGQWLQKGRRFAPIMVMAPFIRTPANVLKEFAKRSPLALGMPKNFWAEIAAGGPRRDLALAKVSTGTALMVWASSLAMEDRITGAGPANPKMKAAWEATGRKPYSFRIGDEWVPFGRFEPLATLFGTTADLVDFYKYKDPGAEDDALAMQALGAVVENLGNKSFLQGVANAAAAFDDPGRNGARFVQQLAGGMIPYSGLVGAVEAMGDPAMRDTSVDPTQGHARRQFDLFLNAWKAKTPGWSDELPPRRNLWGEERRAYEGEWYHAVNPLAPWSMKSSKVDEELLRLHFPIDMPKRTIEGAPLTPHQYDRLVMLQGRDVKDPATGLNQREALEKIIADSRYQMMTDIDKGERLRAVHVKYLSAAQQVLLDDDADLLGRATISRAMREAGLAR